MPNVTVICGGVGAARFLRGLVQVVDPADITAVVNVGDDLELHGLAISPDIDTVIYTVAGAIDPERGWGLADETWNAMASLGRFGEPPWFNLGDRDIGTHLYRTQRLDEGATLAEVTAEIADAWDLGFAVLPATNDRWRTYVTLPDEEGIEVSFQEYFVKRQHSVRVSGVAFRGAPSSEPAPGVIEAITDADVVVIAPSNPVVSIGPILAVPGVRETIVSCRSKVVAVSPIVAGAALKGPADRMMGELGFEPSALGVARIYAPHTATLVIDEADAPLAERIESETGLRADMEMRCVVTPTVMKTPELAAALARTTIDAVLGGLADMTEMRVFGIEDLPEIRPWDDLAGIIAAAASSRPETALADGDVVVVTQKIVSKAEDQLVPIDPSDPLSHKPLVERESVRILRRRGELIISETKHGFVCANAGIDLSNVEAGYAALLPEDSDRSARRIRDGIRARAGVEVAVIVSDTFGRTWRRGVTDVAIGCAGIRAVVDLRGTTDALGRELAVTEVAVVDEIAAAAELVMGKSSGVPVAVVRGIDPSWLGHGNVHDEIVRHPAEDLFR